MFYKNKHNILLNFNHLAETLNKRDMTAQIASQ